MRFMCWVPLVLPIAYAQFGPQEPVPAPSPPAPAPSPPGESAVSLAFSTIPCATCVSNNENYAAAVAFETQQKVAHAAALRADILLLWQGCLCPLQSGFGWSTRRSFVRLVNGARGLHVNPGEICRCRSSCVQGEASVPDPDTPGRRGHSACTAPAQPCPGLGLGLWFGFGLGLR